MRGEILFALYCRHVLAKNIKRNKQLNDPLYQEKMALREQRIANLRALGWAFFFIMIAIAFGWRGLQYLFGYVPTFMPPG